MPTYCFDFFETGLSHEEYRLDHRQLHRSLDPSPYTSIRHSPPLTRQPAHLRAGLKPLVPLHPVVARSSICIAPLATGFSHLFPVTQTCPFHLLLIEPSLVTRHPQSDSLPFMDTCRW